MQGHCQDDTIFGQGLGLQVGVVAGGVVTEGQCVRRKGSECGKGVLAELRDCFLGPVLQKF